MKDYYVVLGVSPRDPPESIRDAYRQLAKRHHPDRAGSVGAEAFREIAEAYDVLSDAGRRADHDRSLGRAEERLVPPDTGSRTPDPPVEPLAPHPGSIPRGGRRVCPWPDAFPDRLPRDPPPARTATEERLQEAFDLELSLSRADAARGGLLRIALPALQLCPACRGRGGDGLWPCPRCDDRGVIEVVVPHRVRIPPHLPEGTVLVLPLDSLGVGTTSVRLRLRVD